METKISENIVVIGKDYPNKIFGKAVYIKVELFLFQQNAIPLSTGIGPFSFKGELKLKTIYIYVCLHLYNLCVNLLHSMSP